MSSKDDIQRHVLPIPDRPRTALICLSLLASFLLLGFAMQAQDSAKKQESGFLGDYSKLQPDPKNADLLIYWKNPDVLKTSNKFILDRIAIYLLPEAAGRAIDPDDLAKLAQDFSQAITDELKSGHYEVVATPGPGVMVLRVAITNLEPTGG